MATKLRYDIKNLNCPTCAIEIEKDIKREVRNAKKEAWSEFLAPHLAYKKDLVKVLRSVLENTQNTSKYI